MSARLAWSDRPAAALVALVATLVAGADNGGYFPRSWTLLTVVFGCFAGIALLLRGPIAGRRHGFAVAVLLGAFVVWESASAAWGIAGTAATDEARRTLVYVVALVAFLVVVGSDAVPAFVAGAVLGIVGLSAYGLVAMLRAATPDPYEGRLLFEPTGYANAQGILASVGILLALGLAVDARTRPARLAAGAAAVFLLVALTLTGSRGAWAALAGGAAMLLARRISWRLVASAVGVLTVGAIILHPALPHGDRGAYWRVAAHDVRQHPLLGSGAGSFAAVWEDSSRARTGVSVRDAHNLYLETLAETGPFGLALLLGALGLPLALTRRVWDAPLGPSLAAAYLAFLLHAAVDWDWEIPAVVLTGLACAAAVVVQSNLLLHRPGTTP